MRAVLARLAVLAVAVTASVFATAAPASAGTCLYFDPWCNLDNVSARSINVVNGWCNDADDTPVRSNTWPTGCKGTVTTVAGNGGVGYDQDAYRAEAGCVTKGRKFTYRLWGEDLVEPFTHDLTWDTVGLWHRFHDYQRIVIDSINCYTPSPSPAPIVAPRNLRVAAVTPTSVSLAWDTSTGLYYRILRNGSLLAVVGTGSYTDTGLKPSTTYPYMVKACGDDGGDERCITAYINATTSTGSSGGGGGGGGGGGTWPGSRNDLNSDGKADLLAVYTDTTLVWYPGKGDGGFWSARTLSNANFRLMAKADLNNDGKKDMLAVYEDNTLAWYPGKGDGGFWSARVLSTANFRSMALADLDRDGKVDLLAVLDDYTLVWYPGKGDGGFWSSRVLSTANFRTMALADLDGDSIPDMLALYNDYTLAWYPGKGDGTFWSARIIGPAGFSHMSLGDLDGDSKADLLAVYTDGTFAWYPGKGDGGFWSARVLGSANGFKLMAL
ncbi:FG-GAP-like repeat-containing protein [Catellatospora bangladeshensis]|uniref:Fibronectin type-III domain-containing protein n=1 Tax=Catellatospora bangladeshensis TaxID=310355 RepID=A0A8J3NH24_9ACTN|nr:FG-GAP-like repeat-containing protein [Catellatospora bangladeshensis]GIF80950.1 hypothetical protein Cba03nite_22990 [Catellatospora bangladeshensis]